MKKIIIILLIPVFCLGQINSTKSSGIEAVFSELEHISGNTEYLASPYVTAGDKLYMVGNQDGSFPDLGWHIQGEMGGVWCHPIKLLDGFEAEVKVNNYKILLNKADKFDNYPIGNKITYSKASDFFSVERYQFVPDGKKAVYIEYVFKNKTNQDLKLEIDISQTSNLMPTWLGERTGMVDDVDSGTFEKNINGWVFKDLKNSWFCAVGSKNKGESIKNSRLQGSKINAYNSASVFYISLPANSKASLPLVIAGSMISEEDLKNTFKDVSEGIDHYLIAKKKRFEDIEQNSKVTLNDKELEKGFRWIKYNTDWLIRDVDSIGRGLSAGLPDYPWWFGVDNEYTLKALIATGRKDLVYSTIDLIHRISKNGNGKIMHEVSTNGAIFNDGNINETPQFASMVWEVFNWTGDIEFLKKYFPTIENGLKWLLKENDKDGNLLPEGFGMMEIHGLNSEMIDVACYSQRAFSDASKMANILGKKKLSIDYLKKSKQITETINTKFWVEEFNSYADFIGTKEQALKLIEDAVVRADTLNKPWAVVELQNTKTKLLPYPNDKKMGFVLFHNWVVNTPMEMGIADSIKALKALETAKKFTNPFGMFVTGIDRDELSGSDDGSFAQDKKIFSYTGAVMTLPTGVQAVSENNYNRPNEAYFLLKKMMKSFSYALPGSIYEVSPDFGMFTQAWNMYAFGEPIIKQFFGINPQAYFKKISINPSLPKDLSNGKVENVNIGDNMISLTFTNSVTLSKFKIVGVKTNWNIEFSQPKGKYKYWKLNGKNIVPLEKENFQYVILKGLENNLELSN